MEEVAGWKVMQGTLLLMYLIALFTDFLLEAGKVLENLREIFKNLTLL